MSSSPRSLGRANWRRALEVPGFMEPEELDWLYQQALVYDKILEVGTWKGRSTVALASGWSAKVWTVDHFQGSPSEIDGAHENAPEAHGEAEVNLAPYSNVEMLVMSSLQASRMFADESLDMVFIDGSHEREDVLIDLIAWRPKVRKLLCGHDRNWPGVYEALAIYGIAYEYGPGSLWFMEVKQ